MAGRNGHKASPNRRRIARMAGVTIGLFVSVALAFLVVAWHTSVADIAVGVIVLFLLSCLIWICVYLPIAAVVRTRRFAREGRLRRYREQPLVLEIGRRSISLDRPVRWSIPTLIGALMGAAVALLYFSRTERGPQILLGVLFLSAAGVLVAAAVEYLVLGPGRIEDRTLRGAFVTNRVDAAAIVVGGGVLPIAVHLGHPGSLDAVVVGAFVMVGGLVGHVAYLVGEGMSELFFDGGRDLLPRRLFGASVDVGIAIDRDIAAAGATISGHLMISPRGRDAQFPVRLDLIRQVRAQFMTPNDIYLETHSEEGAEAVADHRDSVVGGRRGPQQVPFALVLPSDAVPTTETTLFSVSWLVRAHVAAPHRLDAIAEVAIAVVAPPYPTTVHERSGPSGLVIDRDAASPGAVVRCRPVSTTRGPAQGSIELVRRLTVEVGLGEEQEETVAVGGLLSTEDDAGWTSTVEVPATLAPTAAIPGIASVKWLVRFHPEGGGAPFEAPLHVYLSDQSAGPIHSFSPSIRRRAPLFLRFVGAAATLGVVAVLAANEPDRPGATSPTAPPRGVPTFVVISPIEIPSFRPLPSLDVSVPSFDFPSCARPAPRGTSCETFDLHSLQPP